jgi:uncharacterized membrane protein
MTVLPLFSLFAFILMLVLLPLAFGELMATSLAKLHLSPEMALLLMMAIIIGGFVNIPVKRITHERVVPMHPLAVIGLGGFWPGMVRERRETIIAVNFGGCVVPTGLAVYELLHLSAAGAPALLALLVTAGVNIVVCYFVARPVQGVGILLPGLVPAAVAALLALIFAPGDAAPVAYVAVLPGRSSALTFCTSGRSSRALSAWLVLAGPERSMVSSSRALLPRIWHDVPRERASLCAFQGQWVRKDAKLRGTGNTGGG